MATVYEEYMRLRGMVESATVEPVRHELLEQVERLYQALRSFANDARPGLIEIHSTPPDDPAGPPLATNLDIAPLSLPLEPDKVYGASRYVTPAQRQRDISAGVRFPGVCDGCHRDNAGLPRGGCTACDHGLYARSRQR